MVYKAKKIYKESESEATSLMRCIENKIKEELISSDINNDMVVLEANMDEVLTDLPDYISESHRKGKKTSCDGFFDWRG